MFAAPNIPGRGQFYLPIAGINSQQATAENLTFPGWESKLIRTISGAVTLFPGTWKSTFIL